MPHEAVIRLEIKERDDRSLYVSSPDLPFLHITVPTRTALQEIIPPLVRELLERNRGIKANVRMVDVIDPEDSSFGSRPSPHIIAETRA